MVAAVADWRVEPSTTKLKKSEGPPQLKFVANPDILADLASSPDRPQLVVGFAAETESVVENAIAKQVAKGADWIVANDVSGDVMGGAHNRVHLVTRDGVEHWPEMTKDDVAHRLIERVSKELR
jgi:phosphopantothenoylcysteine decarboxylase/phosphopantothenate--cysteine ligase